MMIITHSGDPDKALRQQREFYEALGRAISQWAMVEDAIYHTFRTIIDPGDWVGAAAAFHAVINANTKLDMIDAAISVSKKHAARHDDWITLHNKIRKRSSRRAKLAHWTVIQNSAEATDGGALIYLEPPTYDFTAKSDERGQRERIGIKRIIEWTNGFARLAMEVDAFWRQLSSP